jgi:hypothetical protein
MQEIDAERRIRILRGLPVDDLPESRGDTDILHTQRSNDAGRDRKRRKLAGEDDTDRDIRYARESQASSYDSNNREKLRKASNAPLYDTNGHINLFPENAKEASRKQKESNPEAEAEKARKEREYEDQYTMRFSNAAGFKQSIGEKPWYHNHLSTEREVDSSTSRNVWGGHDPKRKERAQERLNADDPLAAIQKGVQGVRKAEKGRKEWQEQRRKDIDDLIDSERKEARRRKRHNRRNEEDDLEGFSLDAEAPNATEKRHHRHRHRDSHHHRHYKDRDRRRSRSPQN